MTSARCCCVFAVLLPLALAISGLRAGDDGSGGERKSSPASAIDRAPAALALSPDGTTVATANRVSGTVSFVNWKTGEVLAEVFVGRQPQDVLWQSETRLLVTLRAEDALAVLDRAGESWRTTRRIALGDEPHDLALSGGETPRLFIALAGEDAVAILDPHSLEVAGRLEVGGIPQTVTVSPDARYVITACTTPGRVFVHDARTLELLSQRPLFDQGFALGRPVVTSDSAQVIIPHPVNRTFPVHEDNIEKGWVIDNRLTRLPLPDGEYWQQKQLGLDTRGAAAGDANAVALSNDGRWLVVTCGGSHELLILDFEQLAWPEADPGDFIPYQLRDNDGLFRKIRLGGRPVDVLFADDAHAVIANDFDNSVQVVDVAGGRIKRRILLGGPEVPSLARRGEMIFFDAERSLDSWFSCHTCHPHGHTCGQTFDTVNDGNHDTYKLVPSLRGVTKTGPWTWHGWQTSLEESLKKSLHDTLGTPIAIAEEDLAALMAYLESLEHPENPHRAPDGELTAAAKRGETLFSGKAGCINCHAGEFYTTAATYDLGQTSNRYFYRELNPPSLRGLHARRRFLHDGRAESLEEVLTRRHRPESTGGDPLTDEELRDLLAYLKSL